MTELRGSSWCFCTVIIHKLFMCLSSIVSMTEHIWSELHGDYWRLECGQTGRSFWDIERSRFNYCPSCGEEL